ncbi:hypothetical protein ANN_23008 [Periplaneta americana]|uniref:Uncharacterized protein n=1 Tax=Periplaneta americana TaxID=6978 RepID=A0ABQ8SKW5_PERAM|nr:hypothetical protein ANN_23008 [Periplaneta americana]
MAGLREGGNEPPGSLKAKQEVSLMKSVQADHRPLANDVPLIQQAIEISPSVSTHHLSNELDIHRATVWRDLRFTLHKRAYHLHLVQED